MKIDAPSPQASAMALRPLLAAIGLALCCSVAGAADAGASAAPNPSSPTAARKAVAPRAYFATPQEGFDALVAAMRNNDGREVARILGPGHARIVDSGDAAADQRAAAGFVADYDKKHTVEMDGDAKAFIVAGESDWPMPVPMIKADQGWTFDARAGEKELLARRVGRNELDTIQTCLAFIDMQTEYAEADRNGDGLLEYAARFISSPGRHDGLYWPTAAGEAPSPAGPLFADANQQYRQNVATPYHGYYYRILTAQGKHAPDGAMSYFANGKLIGGVALIAYPATYRNSGVKTFICSMSELVYEKDLGPQTSSVARKIKTFDPDASWTKVN